MISAITIVAPAPAFEGSNHGRSKPPSRREPAAFAFSANHENIRTSNRWSVCKPRDLPVIVMPQPSFHPSEPAPVHRSGGRSRSLFPAARRSAARRPRGILAGRRDVIGAAHSFNNLDMDVALATRGAARPDRPRSAGRAFPIMGWGVASSWERKSRRLARRTRALRFAAHRRRGSQRARPGGPD